MNNNKTKYLIAVLCRICWLSGTCLNAQPHHDLKYDPLSLLDHKLTFAYEYIPSNGKWGLELSWERYAINDAKQTIRFPPAEPWDQAQYIKVANFQRSYQGYYLQLRRFFNAR